MKKIVEHIADIDLFKGLTEDDHEALAMIVMDQTCKRGQYVFAEGDEGTGFYVVITGRVKVFKLSPDGKEQILHIFGSGDPFAEVAVFTGSTYPANAMALEKSRLFFFPRASFVELIAARPSLAMNMLATLSLRLKQFAHLIEALSLKEVPGRLAAYLLAACDESTGADRITLAISKTQLAGLLGTIPETLSRILTKMSNQGLIASNGNQISLLDRQRMHDLADGEIRLG